MIDRYEGTMLGLAIGDALGYPVEFMKLPEIHRRFGESGVVDLAPAGGLQPGSYSDDTQMSLAVARALIAADGSMDEKTLVANFRKEFVEWGYGPDNNRAPGITCMEAMKRMADGYRWFHCGMNNSKGCGTAMRSAPIGMLWRDNPWAIVFAGILCSRGTHGHPSADAGSIATAYLVSLALRRVDPALYIEKLAELTESVSNEFAIKIRQVREALGMDPEDGLKMLGEGWVAEEAVAAALYCFLCSPDDYRSTVLMAANTNGDSDSIACIAGAISGAYNGAGAIPQEWRSKVENREELLDTARKLYHLAGGEQ